MANTEQPRLSPVGLEPGDTLKSPWDNLEVLEMRGDYTGGEDTREWHVEAEETGEMLWVDFDFLLEVSIANLGTRHGDGW